MLRTPVSAHDWSGGTRLGGAIVASIALMVMIGWITGSHVLTAVRPTYIPMAPNSAALFLLLGASVALLTVRSRQARLAARCAITIAFVVAAARFIEYDSGTDFGVDRWMFSFESRHLGFMPVGKMAFYTAVSFLLASTAVFIQSFPKRPRVAGDVAGMLALLVTLIGLVFSLGYMYQAPLLYGGTVIPMALLSSIAFVVLGLSIAVPTARRDLAEQRERERDRAHIDGAFEHAALGMALVSPDGRWLRVNRAICELLGYSESELLTTTFQAITHPDDMAQDLAFVQRMLVGEINNYEMEKRYFHRRGHAIWALLSVSLVRDADGTPRYFISQLQDISERKRAEAELTRQAVVFETIGDGVLLMDLTGTIIDCNSAACRLFGYSKSELLGQAVVMVHDPALQGELEAQIQAALNSEHRWSGELPFRRKDGRRGIADVMVVAQLDEHGRAVAWIGVNREVTERRLAETALSQSRALLAVAEELAHVGSWSLDAATSTLTWSDELFRIFGREPEGTHLTSEWFLAQVHDDDRPSVRATFRQLVETGSVEPVECRILRPDGSVRIIQARGRVQRDAAGRSPVALGSVQDVTDRVEAERALKRAHATVAALLDAAPLAILALDAEGRVTMWNMAAERLFGWTASEVIGTRLPIVAGEDEPESLRLHQGVLDGRCISGFETRRRRKDGSLVDVLLSVAPLREGTAAASGMVGLFVDVTERRQLEEQLRQSQRLEAVGQLAGGVAHDFNNLLTVITSYAALLLDDLDPSHDRRRDVEEIAKAADRAASLTQQLLAFGRRQLLQPMVVDVNANVTELQRMLRRLLTANIELVTVLDPTLRSVRADPGQLEQVIMNLVVNARDAMPDGGTLTIETANVEIDDAATEGRHGHTVRPGQYVRIAVSDTGHGMDASTQARIFEPFFTTKELGKGTGLGLSTVYGIVKQSGGYVWCYSEPGRGTTFKVYLPRADESAEPAAAALRRATGARGRESVLIVEDDDAVRSAAGRILTNHGYSVFEAADGATALRLCEECASPVDLVLTDVIMPELNGSEMAKRLRERHPDIRVLFMSGYTGEVARRQNVLEPGAAFIEKPFAPDVLAAKVRELLDDSTPDAHANRSH